MALIHEKIIAVMRDVEPISKDRNNSAQGYKFRGIDDVYAALHNVLAKHGLFTVPEVLTERVEDRTTRNGSALVYRILTIKFTFYAEDGTSVSSVVVGEGMDSGDKASNKAMSVAHKYALLQVFAIPTDDAKDPENESHDVAPKTQTTRSAAEDMRAAIEEGKRKKAAELVAALGIDDKTKGEIWNACGKDIDKFIARLEDNQIALDAAFDMASKKLDFVDDIPK